MHISSSSLIHLAPDIPYHIMAQLSPFPDDAIERRVNTFFFLIQLFPDNTSNHLDGFEHMKAVITKSSFTAAAAAGKQLSDFAM